MALNSTHRKHPYAGPVWTGSPLTGSFTVGTNGSATQGPNVQTEFLLISAAAGSGSVSINNIGSASVNVGGCPITTAPQYIPCDNLNQLFFVASGASTINYFGW